MRSVARTSESLSELIFDSWRSYAQLYTNAAVETGSRLMQGRIEPGEMIADAVALSHEGVSATLNFWKKAFQLYGSQLDASSANQGTVFFQIDADTETTSPLPLGGVDVAELDSLQVSDLQLVGGAQFIPKACVSLTSDDSDVLVALVSMGKVIPKLPAGVYRGSIRLSGGAKQPSVDVASIEVELT